MSEQVVEPGPEQVDTGWLAVGAVIRVHRKGNGRWWPMTGVIEGVSDDERYLLRDRETGERWLPKIEADVLRITEVISPGYPKASMPILTFAEAVNWKNQAPKRPVITEPRNRVQQMSEVFRSENELRRKVGLGERKGWTREQWVAEAEEIMNDTFGSVTLLLNGHIMAIFEELHALREQVPGQGQDDQKEERSG